MGRRRRNNNQNTEKGGDNWSKNKKDGYDIIVKKNNLFEKYYRQLNLIEESEFEKFLDILKQPLPITFRITSYKSFSNQLLKMLKEKHFKYIDEITKENGEEVRQASANKGASLLTYNYKNENSGEILNEEKEIYKCLTWYPNEFAWQVNLSRQDVRKNTHFEEFKQFLIHHTENGHLNRQEAVSMIPPLLLEVESHHKVLDMCASPGSKTAQLIEFLHRDKSNPVPEGFVIANDLDNKRCYMLMHQLKRLESPNFMIINHDASALPNFRDFENPNKNIQFDRILADVPCSGDGTFRKNIDLWTKWNFSHACNLHGIQARIAKRAAELLAPGGIMVYSTCSLNPVENEAVVYNLLLKFKDQLELVDARDKLPGLKSLKGMLKWNLMSKSGEIYNTHDQVKPEFAYLMRPYMFPPEESVAKELNLERCIRILPHHQNTGGFFIAVIRKLPLEKQIDLDKNFLSQENKTDSTTIDSKEENDKPSENLNEDQNEKVRAPMKAPPAKRLKHTFDENPFHFMDETNQIIKDWSKIEEFYGINKNFPKDQMMTRNRPGENVKSVYFVSEQIRDLTTNNGDRFKFINMGVPLFSRYDLKDQCNVELRVCQESLDIMLKYFNRRIIVIKEKSDLLKLLFNSMPFIKEFSEELQKEITKQTENLVGSLIMTHKCSSDDKESEDLSISFTAWVGKASIRPLINIHVRRFFLNLINVEQNEINEALNKIKQEDQANSEKSRMTNPQYKNNGQEKIKVNNKDMDGLTSEDEKNNEIENIDQNSQ